MAHRPSETLFQTACDLCKMPFPSLLRRQEPSLKRSFSCLANSRHQYENNQIFDFIKNLFFLRMHETSKALLCTGHPPARVRQISGFAKVSACCLYWNKWKLDTDACSKTYTQKLFKPRAWLRYRPYTRFEIYYFCIAFSLISIYQTGSRYKHLTSSKNKHQFQPDKRQQTRPSETFVSDGLW